MVRKWIVGPISRGDQGRVSDLYSRHKESGTSFIRRFQNFIELNPAFAGEPLDLLEGLVGQLLRYEMKWSTISVYLKQAVQYLNTHGGIPLAHRPSVALLQKLIRLEAAGDDVRKAASVTLPDIERIIAASGHPHHQAFFNLLAISGARWADLRRLQRSQLRMYNNGSLRIQWRVTKARRSQSDRISIHYPVELGVTVSNELFDFLQLTRGSPHLRPFSAITVDHVNSYLRIACAAAEISPRITTYSFRHNFVLRVYKYCRITKEPLCTYTGHFNDRIVQAAYGEGLMTEDEEETALEDQE